MGATIQRTRYSKSLRKILQDDTVAKPDDEVTVVSGFNILTNGQVSNVMVFVEVKLDYPVVDQLNIISSHRHPSSRVRKLISVNVVDKTLVDPCLIKH